MRLHLSIAALCLGAFVALGLPAAQATPPLSVLSSLAGAVAKNGTIKTVTCPASSGSYSALSITMTVNGKTQEASEVILFNTDPTNEINVKIGGSTAAVKLCGSGASVGCLALLVYPGRSSDLSCRSDDGSARDLLAIAVAY